VLLQPGVKLGNKIKTVYINVPDATAPATDRSASAKIDFRGWEKSGK
jgi:hypothetical protein